MIRGKLLKIEKKKPISLSWEKDDSLILLNFENILREVLWKERPYKKNNNDVTDDDDNNDFNFQRHLLYINVDCLWPMFNLVIAVVVILRKY